MTAPTADDPDIKLVPAAVTERGVVAYVLNAPTVDTIDWGDGTRSVYSSAAAVHAYASAKAYTVTALAGETVVASRQVYVRDGLAPNVTFAPDANNPNLIVATFGDDPEDLVSKYEVTWEAGAVETLFAAKGTTRSHGFRAGTHTIVVRDLHTRRVLTEDIEVKDKTYDPDFDFAKGADTMTVEITLKNVKTKKEIVLAWGDGDQTLVPASEAVDGTKKSHTFLDADSYIVQCVYKDGSTEGSADLVTVPFPARAGR